MSMQRISVEPYPPLRSYDSINAAIEGAHNHPLQQRAMDDSQRLAGTSLLDAIWTERDFGLRFSNRLHLHVFARGRRVQWSIQHDLDIEEPQRVGASPILLQWPDDVSDYVMDCSSMIAHRRGCRFTRLFVNEMGLWLYLHRRMILHFSAVRRTDTGEYILCVTESE